MQQTYRYSKGRSTGRQSEFDGPPPVEQEWHRSGSCPRGTIPIRRLPETAVTPNLTVISPGHDNNVIDDSKSPRYEVCGQLTTVYSPLLIFSSTIYYNLKLILMPPDE